MVAALGPQAIGQITMSDRKQAWIESVEPVLTDSVSGLRFSIQKLEWLNFEAWVSSGWLSHSLLPFGKYERPVFMAIKKYLPRGAKFCDVGANVGLMSIFARNISEGGEVFAMEPEDRIRFILAKNFEHNGIPTTSISENAAGESSSVGDLTLSELPAMTSIVRSLPSGCVKQPVVIETLDKVLPWIPYAIKIDTEGYELEVMSGAVDTFSKMEKGSFVIAEPHPRIGTPAKVLGEKLASLGFEVFQLNGDGELHPLSSNDAQVIGFKK